ncbi:replication initiation protein [Salmonella enterica subsp. enterica]|nr:replication initiation protein [Salmonella enterica subsp. enterica]
MNLLKVTKKTKIRHRNEINNTFSSLPLSVRRILFMAMAQIDTRQELSRGDVFRITAKEYAFIADIDMSVAYKQLREGAEELQASVIRIPKNKLINSIQNEKSEDKLKKKKTPTDAVRVMNITSFCDYVESEGFVEIGFSNVIEPYITMLKDSYTTQVLLSSVRLTDQNANILYQFIRKQISMGKTKSFDITVTDLKDELELYKLKNDNKIYLYQNYKDFNKAFLNKNIDKINQFTEIKKLSVTIIERVSRKASKLRFSYTIDKESEGQDYRVPHGFRT